MVLHPQARSMIEAFSRGPQLDYRRMTAAEFRSAFEVPTPAAAAAAAKSDRVIVEDARIEIGARALSVRLYRPSRAEKAPITLFVHGGGFVIGSPAMTDGICRALCAEAGSLVISPDYRLAPEAPFPAGLEDCLSALRWAHENAERLGGIASKIAVAGDSSGGNFAAAIAQICRAEGGPPLCHQLLLYPVLDFAFGTASYASFAHGYFLTAEMMRWYWTQYLNDKPAEGADWRASPARQADLRGLPPATIFTAEYDVLRDEAEEYAGRLRRAGCKVQLKRWDGQIHGFLLQQGIIDDADRAISEAAAALRAAFDGA